MQTQNAAQDLQPRIFINARQAKKFGISAGFGLTLVCIRVPAKQRNNAGKCSKRSPHQHAIGKRDLRRMAEKNRRERQWTAKGSAASLEFKKMHIFCQAQRRKPKGMMANTTIRLQKKKERRKQEETKYHHPKRKGKHITALSNGQR